MSQPTYGDVEFEMAPGDSLHAYEARLRIIRELTAGQGTKGITYLAEVLEDQGLVPYLTKGAEVVVKVPRLSKSLTKETKAATLAKLFYRQNIELRSTTQLNDLDCAAKVLHHGMFWLYRVSRQPEQVPVIVQEFIRGPRLDLYLVQANDPFRGLGEKDYLDLARALLRSVKKVHAKNIVHGDIWQGNFIVKEDAPSLSECLPVLIDFGEATFTEDTVVSERYNTGTWWAPEERTSLLGDIHRLGYLLLYLAIGSETNGDGLASDHTRFKDDGRLLLQRVEDEIRERNPQLYHALPPLPYIICKCLSHNPRQRPHSVDEILRLLDVVSGGETTRERNTVLLQPINNRVFERLSALKERIFREESMQLDRKTFDFYGSIDEISELMALCMSTLRSGDEYLTISSPTFWNRVNFGSHGLLYLMNEQAISRGVVIRRLLLICREDSATASAQEELVEILRRQAVLDDAMKAITGKDHSYIRCQLVTQNRRQELLGTGRNFGLLSFRNDSSEPVLMALEYAADSRICGVKLRAEATLGKAYQGEFDDKFDEAEALNGFVERYGLLSPLSDGRS